jgi:hypothetical protein
MHYEDYLLGADEMSRKLDRIDWKDAFAIVASELSGALFYIKEYMEQYIL